MKKITKVFMALLVVSSMLFAMIATVACTPKSDDPCANGHTPTAVAKKDATCTEKGNEAYWICSVCNKKFSDEACTQEITAVPEIAAKGHGTANAEGKCPVCGEKIADPKPTEPTEPETPTPFATAAFDGFVSSGEIVGENANGYGFVFSDEKISGTDDYYSSMLIYNGLQGAQLEFKMAYFAYTLEDNEIALYPTTDDFDSVGTDTCGSGTITGKNLTFSVKYTPDEEGATEQTATFNHDMYKLTLTGTDERYPTSLYVGKDSYFGVVACNWMEFEGNVVTFNGTAVADEEALFAIKMPAQDSTLAVTVSINYGTEEDPLTVAEAIALAKSLGEDNYSESQAWITGYVLGTTSVSTQTQYTYQFNIIDEGNESDKFNVYYAQFSNGKPYENDKVLVCGYLQNYKGSTMESCTSQDGPQSEHTGKILERGTSEITALNVEHATITLDSTSGENATTFTFSVTVDAEYKIASVKVNSVAVEESGGKYTGIIEGPTTVSVVVEPLAGNPNKLATFLLGDNGEAKHADGTGIKDDWADTSNNYTLSFTQKTNVYSGARDEKGNGCLKLGTGSKAGSFTFTVADDVQYVKIYIASYKSETGCKVTVNGTETSITATSNSGEYQVVVVDVTSTKTVTLSVTGKTRCMINTIEYWLTQE